MNQPLDTRQQRLLLQLARRVIVAILETGKSPTLPAPEDEPRLREPGAAFVTLTKAGQLRGCIGSLVAVEPLWDSVRRHAENAAFQDPRFSPLAADEAQAVHIEISVLSAPEPLTCADPAELLALLNREHPGLILSDAAGGRATFLPQVWEQLPRAEDFLAALCRKAGLAPDAWRRGGLTYQRYGVQHFEEGEATA